MAEIIKRSKPMSVNPLKASSSLGASLAFLGMRRAIPMLHSLFCTPLSRADPTADNGHGSCVHGHELG